MMQVPSYFSLPVYNSGNTTKNIATSRPGTPRFGSGNDSVPDVYTPRAGRPETLGAQRRASSNAGQFDAGVLQGIIRALPDLQDPRVIEQIQDSRHFSSVPLALGTFRHIYTFSVDDRHYELTLSLSNFDGGLETSELSYHNQRNQEIKLSSKNANVPSQSRPMSATIKISAEHYETTIEKRRDEDPLAYETADYLSRLIKILERRA